jgi:hypothetical protein
LQILYFILHLCFTTVALAFHVIAKDEFRISRIRKIIVRRVCNQNKLMMGVQQWIILLIGTGSLIYWW